MSKIWRIVIAIVLVAVLFGVVCIGVGMITGADTSRIYARVNSKYNIDMYYDWLTVDVYNWLLTMTA